MKLKTFYVYKTTNIINNKIYIGQRSYKDDIKEDKYLGSGKLLKQAFIKYTRKFFTKEILEVCEARDINKKEMYWIAFYNSTDLKIGYNLCRGGNSDLYLQRTKVGTKHTPETLQKISQKLKGRKKDIRDEAYCRNISKSKLGSKNPMYGKKSIRAKPVIQLTKDDKIIEIHDNCYVAAKFVNGNHSHIAACCRNKRKTHIGFKWKFKYEDDEKIK